MSHNGLAASGSDIPSCTLFSLPDNPVLGVLSPLKRTLSAASDMSFGLLHLHSLVTYPHDGHISKCCLFLHSGDVSFRIYDCTYYILKLSHFSKADSDTLATQRPPELFQLLKDILSKTVNTLYSSLKYSNI